MDSSCGRTLRCIILLGDMCGVLIEIVDCGVNATYAYGGVSVRIIFTLSTSWYLRISLRN